jgi:hypothetical protein
MIISAMLSFFGKNPEVEKYPGPTVECRVDFPNGQLAATVGYLHSLWTDWQRISLRVNSTTGS